MAIVAPIALSPEQIRALERLSNRATAYEIEIVGADGARFLMQYSQRHSKPGVRQSIFDRWDDIKARFPAIRGFRWHGKECRLDSGEIIRFSGRTQRQAIIEGRLPRLSIDPTD